VSDPSASDGAALPPEVGPQIDEVCNRFVASWRSGQAPRIEDHAVGWKGPTRAALLRQLVLLDADLRRKRGEALSATYYLGRFPELDPAWLAHALAVEEQPTTPHSPEGAPLSEGLLLGKQERAVKWVRRHPAWAAAVLLFAAFLGVGVWAIGLVFSESGAPDQLYVYQLAEAQQEWQKGNRARAREILAGTARSQRRVEFGLFWAQVNGQEKIRALNGDRGVVYCVAFSPDGKRIVSGSVNGLTVWDADTGQAVLGLNGLLLNVTGVAYSPDGKRIVSGSQSGFMGFDQNLKVWDADTGQEVLTLKGRRGPVAFSPDGKRIVCGGRDNTLKIWDTDTGQEIRTRRVHTYVFNCVAFSPDGKRIVSGGDYGLTVWDADTGQEVLTLKGGGNCVAYSPDGKRIVSRGFGGSGPAGLTVWDADNGQAVLTLEGSGSGLSLFAISPDGKRIVGRSRQYDALEVWDVDTGQGWAAVLLFAACLGMGVCAIGLAVRKRRALLAACLGVGVWAIGLAVRKRIAQ
jgi:outer membrane protein assembly factor BamB